MSAPSLESAGRDDHGFTTRWATWQAAGLAQDRLWHRRAVAVAATGVAAVVGWLVLAAALGEPLTK